MKIFAISDLHLSTLAPKPMDIFSSKWENHFEKISMDWKEKVSDEDVVIIAGDISWAMYLEDAMPDIELIHNLPGKKVIIKGNHDYWWQSITKIRNIFPKDFYVIQNDAIKIEDVIFCGARLWSFFGSETTADDIKIADREGLRLKLSLDSAMKLKEENDKVICITHYPPFDQQKHLDKFTKIIDSYDVDKIVFGHIHGANKGYNIKTVINDKEYYLTSCDQLDFKLLEI